MSNTFYDIESLRFYSEDEIELAIGLDRLVEIYTHWNEEFPR